MVELVEGVPLAWLAGLFGSISLGCWGRLVSVGVRILWLWGERIEDLLEELGGELGGELVAGLVCKRNGGILRNVVVGKEGAFVLLRRSIMRGSRLLVLLFKAESSEPGLACEATGWRPLAAGLAGLLSGRFCSCGAASMGPGCPRSTAAANAAGADCGAPALTGM